MAADLTSLLGGGEGGKTTTSTATSNIFGDSPGLDWKALAVLAGILALGLTLAAAVWRR